LTKNQLQVTYDPDSSSHPGFVYLAVVLPSHVASYAGAAGIA